MAQIKYYTTLIIENKNNTKNQPITTSKVLTYTASEVKEFAITASSTVVIYDPTTDATEAASNFDFLYLLADKNLDVEFTCNEGHANEELFTIRLVKDTPLVLGADDSYYNHSASDAFAGTLDVIDKIRVKEPDAVAVNLTMIVAT